ncbi:MAG: hypothetical protein LBK06_00845 [Planctomycetaceae bacterium]|nr:hypothetical protein [Planctomycetaceae bacterium]
MVKKYLIECNCGFIVCAAIIIVVASARFVLADDKYSLADELVPLMNNAAARGNDVELSGKDVELSGKDYLPVGARRIYDAQLAGNSVGNGVIADETQLGNELREIFARKPEIATDKIPRANNHAESNPPIYRNNNTAPLSEPTKEIVLAQSTPDPLATRPDPPEGTSPDLSAISATLTGDTNIEPANNPQNVPPNPAPAAQPAPPTNENPKDTNSTIMNKNDLASVVNGWLLVATIVSVAALVYVSIIAVDYHQRWIQTLTAQNDRYFATDDLAYGGLADKYESADNRNFGTDFFKPFTL